MKPNFNKLKFLKLHRKKRIIRVNKGKKGKNLSNYELGMVVKEKVTVTASQLESIRKLIVRKLKGKNRKNQKNLKIIKSQQNKKKRKKASNLPKYNFRHNFWLGLTKKPLQVRMGKGKGSPVDWVYPCAKNRILTEISTKKIKEKKARKLLIKAGEKLPVGVKFISVIGKDNRKKIVETRNKITCIQEL